MNTQEFINLVTLMRKLQKDYFKTRNTLTLAMCKKVEKQVDDFLQKSQEPETKKPDLFSNQ